MKFDVVGELQYIIPNKSNGNVLTRKNSLFMMEEFVNQVISSEGIIYKCDQFLQLFYGIHDLFKELVLSDNYEEQKISMGLHFGTFFISVNNPSNCRTIGIELRKGDRVLYEDMTIYIEERYSDVYKYLVANVFGYYLNSNFQGEVIDYADANWNKVIYSKSLEVVLGSLCNSIEYENLLYGLIECHNQGISFELIIDELRSQIREQPLVEGFDLYIDSLIRKYMKVMVEAAENSNLKKIRCKRKKF